MRKTYQGTKDKSKQKFEVLGKRELLMEVLPMVEVWEGLQAQVEQLTGEAGLRIVGTILENEVTRRMGPRIPAKRGKKSSQVRGVRAEMRRALAETLFCSAEAKLSVRVPGLLLAARPCNTLHTMGTWFL